MAKYWRLLSTAGTRYITTGGPAIPKKAFVIPEHEPMRKPIVLLGLTCTFPENTNSYSESNMNTTPRQIVRTFDSKETDQRVKTSPKTEAGINAGVSTFQTTWSLYLIKK